MKFLAYIIATAALAFSGAASAQSFSDQVVDTNNPAPPLADEFGPGTYVDDGLNISSLTEPRGTHTDMEEINAGDTVGAFRFVCNAGWLATIDPVVYPGKVGAAHLHQGYGNTLDIYGTDNGSSNAVAASATYQTERTSGSTTCINAINRSAYWLTALIAPNGMAHRPDYIQVYYKRSPKTHPYCTPGSATFQGTCVGIPTGIRMIFGYDMISGTAPTGYVNFKCQYFSDSTRTNALGETAKYANLVDTLTACSQATNGDPTKLYLIATLVSPQCWDGKNLDSANHRSHTSDMLYDTGNTGRGACPKDHPYVMPFFQQSAFYTLDTAELSTAYVPGQCVSLHFSSDCMPGMTPSQPGTTFHADYSEGWNKPEKQIWTDNCIDRGLSCSGGDFGNGTGMKADPNYPVTTTVASPRLVKRPKMAMEATNITITAPQ